MSSPVILQQREQSQAQSPDLRVDVVTGIDEFADLREQWNDLAASADVSPFQLFEWSFLWWKHLGARPGRTLNILKFSGSEGIIGIAPLILDTASLGSFSIFRRLRFMGCDIGSPRGPNPYREYPLTDYLDFIVAPGCEKIVVSAFVRYLQAQGNLIDEVELVNLRRGSGLLRWLSVIPGGSGMGHELRRGTSCPRVNTPETMTEYCSELGGNHRRRIRQAMEALKDGGTLSLEAPVTQDQAERMFSEMVRLHQRRWNKEGFPGLFVDPRFEAFQRAFLAVLFPQGRVWLRSACSGDRVVAVRLAFDYNGTMYDYLSGVDDESPEAKRRPGLGLLAAMIRDAIEEKRRVVDFLRGTEQYKMQLCNDTESLWNIRIFNQAAIGRQRTYRLLRKLLMVIDRIVREMMMLKILFGCHGVIRGAGLYGRSFMNRFRAALQPAAVSGGRGREANAGSPVASGPRISELSFVSKKGSEEHRSLDNRDQQSGKEG